MLTSHDQENSCALMTIDPKKGFSARERIETENHKVFSACLLNSGIPGVSMSLEAGEEAPTTQTLLLGCNRGYLLKYEKAEGATTWEKTGELRLEQSITDVLQIQAMNVIAVQDEGTFDVIDVTSMQSTAHTPALQGLNKSYKTRLTQRSGGLVIADTNGLFFADIVSDNAGHYTVKLCSNEQYVQNNTVNDFVEFKRDTYFISILEAT